MRARDDLEPCDEDLDPCEDLERVPFDAGVDEGAPATDSCGPTASRTASAGVDSTDF